MSSETAIAQRDTSIPRKVSLRSELNREDSGYLSIIGTPAGTPSVMSVRRTSRADQPQTLKGIPENCLEQEGTPGSSPAPSFFTNGGTRQLQEQLSVPDEERSSHSAPMAYGGLHVPPSFNRTISLDFGNYYVPYTDGNCYKRRVSKRAEQIISRFEKLRTDSDESVATQSPSPVDESEQPREEDIVQYCVPEVSTSSPMPRSIMLQRQFSEFPLDESVLSLGQDGYYLEDRDYNIVRTAGAGGSASCNLGNDNVKCTQFIVKRPKKSYSEEEKQDVMRESRILQQIDHDNVIRFYGLVEDLQNNCFKIFLEYAEETCGDIHHVFCESEDRDSFSGNIALIMLYVQQMLYAVDYLHRETGILHLDIKGKNIVVCNGGYRVKLIDFGTACKASGAQPQKSGWTPVFAAPEVNNQLHPPKFSADIWSVMCVAVEMVTGALPWPKVTSEHEAAMFKVGFYEDNQINELVDYDSSEYWDKYSYYDTHHDMYQELVNMWKKVFRKDSSSRPSAHYLLNLKWMREMDTRGESILYELVSGEEQEQSCVEESCSVENENIGIQINHPPMDDSSQGYNEDNLSGHNFSQPGRSSPYQSNLQYPLSGGHSPAGSDSDAYFDCDSSFSGRNGAYLPEPHFFPSGPSSLPVLSLGTYLNPNSYNYQNTSTPMTSSQFAVDGSMDFTDGRDDNLSSDGRGRSRSFSMQGKPPDIEQVTGKRRKSLCYIGSSKSEPINVLNASGIMDSINKTSVKRVNSLTYVMEGPKTDSPVSSPRIEQQSLVPGTVRGITPQQRRRSSSDVGTPTSTSVMDSGYGDSFKEQLTKCSTSVDQTTLQSSVDQTTLRSSVDQTTLQSSVDQTTLQSSSRLSLPDRDEHKPDGCSEPSETTPHTIQLSLPDKTQQIEVNGSTTVKELMKMTQNTTSRDSTSIILKLQ